MPNAEFCRDLYSVIKDSALLPTEQSKAANYEGMGTWELDRVITIDDVCDFIVTYIESDLLVCPNSFLS